MSLIDAFRRAKGRHCYVVTLDPHTAKPNGIKKRSVRRVAGQIVGDGRGTDSRALNQTFSTALCAAFGGMTMGQALTAAGLPINALQTNTSLEGRTIQAVIGQADRIRRETYLMPTKLFVDEFLGLGPNRDSELSDFLCVLDEYFEAHPTSTVYGHDIHDVSNGLVTRIIKSPCFGKRLFGWDDLQNFVHQVAAQVDRRNVEAIMALHRSALAKDVARYIVRMFVALK